MDKDALTGLLDRVMNEKGPNLATETAIAIILDQAPEGFKFVERCQAWEKWNPAHMNFDTWMPPPWTATIAEALALASKVLPGKHWHICAGRTRPGEPLYAAAFYDHDEDGLTLDEPIGIAEHDNSAALAVIAAMLNALIASAPDHTASPK